MLRRVIVTAVGICVLAAGLGGGRVWREARAVEHYIDGHLQVPGPPFPDLLQRWFDLTPVRVPYTAAWQKFTATVPRHQFETDPTLWQRMHFEDWDRLPARERVVPLHRMLARSGHVIHARECWPTMTAADWDQVPQPIRAIAILAVLDYWTRFYEVGAEFHLSRARMVQVVQSIVMSESWFEHRSLLVNTDGSHDLGLAGASEYARGVIRKWHAAGRVDFAFEADDYYNPWHAARFIAFWFDRMLFEADGDVDVAIRAYNQGIRRAQAGHGDEYLAAVRRRHRMFIAGASRSPTWNTVRAYARFEPPEELPPCTSAVPHLTAPPTAYRTFISTR